MHLISIIVFSQKQNTARSAASALSRFGGVQLHSCGKYELLGAQPCKYLVESVSHLESLTVPRSVLVLADQNVPRRLTLAEDTIVIAGSDNRRARRLLGSLPNTTVICGTGTRDSLTLSSAGDRRIVLCAQRRLPTVQGGWTDLSEFAVEADRCAMRTAILTGAIAAVCGCDLSSGSIVIGTEQTQ